MDSEGLKPDLYTPPPYDEQTAALSRGRLPFHP